MYKTKIIERSGTNENLIKQIDEEANKMFKDGYELITYQLLPIDNRYLIITFKKKEDDC